MPVAEPLIVWRPAHQSNYSNGRGGVLVEAVVWHITDGEGSPAPWFQNPHALASTEFGILPDGTIEQYVSLLNTPFAHGLVEVEYAAARKLIQDNWGVNPNQWAIGIEVVGTTAQVKAGIRPNDAQRDALVHLTAWLFQEKILPNAHKTGAAVDRDHILMHRDISPVSRQCPVWGEGLHRQMIAMVDRLVGAAAPVPEPETEQDRLIDAAVRRSLEWRFPPDLTLSTIWGESEFQTHPDPGDGGHSFGPLQVHIPDGDPWNRNPPEQWEGVEGALAAMDLMGTQWRREYNRLGGEPAWQADPVGFFTTWWPKAQGANPTFTTPRAAESVRQGQTAYQRWLAKQPAPQPEPVPEPEPVPMPYSLDAFRAEYIEALRRQQHEGYYTAIQGQMRHDDAIARLAALGLGPATE